MSKGEDGTHSNNTQWRSEEEVHSYWEILHESVLSDAIGTEDSTSLSLLRARICPVCSSLEDTENLQKINIHRLQEGHTLFLSLWFSFFSHFGFSETGFL